MKNKQKQTMVLVSMMSVSIVISPIPIVKAQDNRASVMQDTQNQREMIHKRAAPDISQPMDLKAQAGIKLQNIELPQDWVWADQSAVVSSDKTAYLAYLTVDDEAYDFTNVTGYHSQEHRIERMLHVTVTAAQTESQTIAAMPMIVTMPNLAPTAFRVGDIAIDETNFPDLEFRKWLRTQSYGTDGVIQQSEIPNIQSINLFSYNNKKNIKDLTGIQYFTSLTDLECDNTGITGLDVTQNPALTILSCNHTGIMNLNVTQNPALTSLDCSSTKITNLDVRKNTDLKSLFCDSTQINQLDVTQNPALLNLFCDHTNITTLDVSHNPSLVDFACLFTNISSLNVSQNTNLTFLDCSFTKITDLDVSHNTNLITLDCSDSKIISLDVTKNTALTSLDCSNNPLTFINIGTNNHLSRFDNNYLHAADVTILGKRFNIADTFPGIDINKITNVQGADYNRATGIMSNYRVAAKITYTYDCGTTSNGNQTIDVTLQLADLRAESSISITEDLNKAYDGHAVNTAPSVSKTGSTGAITYQWAKQKNAADWEVITSPPISAGTYRVTAILAADENFKSATSTPREFTIAKAEPYITIPQNAAGSYGQTLADVTLPKGFAWADQSLSLEHVGTYTFKAIFTPDDTDNFLIVHDVSIPLTIQKAKNGIIDDLTIKGWTFGSDPANALVRVQFGKPRYLYSDKMDGIYTEAIPNSAGTWYVKAVVDDTDNYEGVESEPVAFVIAPFFAVHQIIVPDITADTDLDHLVIKRGNQILVPGIDYDITKTQEGKNEIVMITFKGNYIGTLTKTYKISLKDKTAATGDKTLPGLWTTLLIFFGGLAIFLHLKKQKEKLKR